MKKNFIWNLVPPGTKARRELIWIIIGLTLSAALSLWFVFGYRTSYMALLYARTAGERAGREFTYTMPKFARLLGGSLSGFVIMIAAMALLGLAHRSSFYSGSMSIYLMKRLPDKRTLLKCTWGMPAFGTALSVLTGLTILLIYLAVYYLATPAAWLP